MLHSAVFYPHNYGFIPQTLCGDGDPLDVLVLGEPLVPGAIVDIRVVGPRVSVWCTWWMRTPRGVRPSAYPPSPLPFPCPDLRSSSTVCLPSGRRRMSCDWPAPLSSPLRLPRFPV